MPNAQVNASNTKTGKNIICQEGVYPYHRNISSMIIKEIPRSTRLVITELAGMMSLGKYTLVMRLELPINDPLLSLSALLKNCQGSIPANTISA